jgi:hypothetical protein
MRDFLILFVHVIVSLARLARPGGLRSIVAESALVRHQLLVLNRGRKRAPNLRAADRIITGLCTLFMRPSRILRSAIVLKPPTLLGLHNLLRNRLSLWQPNIRMDGTNLTRGRRTWKRTRSSVIVQTNPSRSRTF